VTDRVLGGVNFRKNKKNCLNLCATKFYPNLLASHPKFSIKIKPNKNYIQNYGKILELDLFEFYLELNVCGLNLKVIQIQISKRNYFQTPFKTLTSNLGLNPAIEVLRRPLNPWRWRS
jgi:hypothetical protein